MNSCPQVSVIMPAYNSEKYIKDTIQCVINQTFSDFELIVIDDCSKDGTAAIVRDYALRDHRIRVISLARNMGAPAGPRNIGVRQARGIWVAFIDSDDIWHPSKLERQLEVLSLTGARFCSTRMAEFIDMSLLSLRDTTADDFEWISFRQQLLKFRTPTSSVIADRVLLLDLPFNEEMSFKAREDLDCWLHCHENIGRSVKIMAPMMGYRIVPGQISGNKWTMIQRHVHVLKQYRFKTGHGLGVGAWFFTFTHFFLSIYYRKFRKML